MTPCKSCGIANPQAERHPHPDIVRAELAAIIREKYAADKADRKAYRDTLRHNMRHEVIMARPTLMALFTQQQLNAGERILREQQNRKNGGTVTN